MMNYNPSNWFWLVGSDTSRAWSSATGAYVSQWPADQITRIASEAELADVLRQYGLALPAISQADYEAAIETHLATVAAARGYKSEASILSYRDSSKATWAAEANAYALWRGSVWDAVYAIMGQVLAGQRAAPTIDGLIAELPVIDWPL